MPTTVTERADQAPIPHGTLPGYFSFGCRCEDCANVGRPYGRERSRLSRQAARVPYETRVAIALSILNHREPSEETCQLAIRALRGYDVIAEAAD